LARRSNGSNAGVRRLKTIIVTAVALALLGAVGAAVFLYTGIYSVAADVPHTRFFRWGVTTLQRNSIERRAPDRTAPELDDPELVQRGFVLYREQCVTCHGAPGVGRDQVGWGINPAPPLLYVRSAAWTDAQLYWIIEHGIKMAGMPAFGPGQSERDIWALVAFSRRLTDLSIDEYRSMAAAMDARIPVVAVEWVERTDPGYAHMVRQADAERGRRLLFTYGCGSCHVIPGVRRATGRAGPPLTRWAERHYIAGSLLNTPVNMVRWLMDPPSMEPGTTMPALGVTAEEALDMARYLYQLGEMPFALHTVIHEGTAEGTSPTSDSVLRETQPPR
jgi:mono/diheme cytochrome c family protein